MAIRSRWWSKAPVPAWVMRCGRAWRNCSTACGAADMASRPRGKNEPPAPIIVKKVTVVQGGHHGGAWKVAYADFVTAMMAFFLLLWLLGATTEDQRKGLADFFTPTLVKTKQQSAGSHG